MAFEKPQHSRSQIDRLAARMFDESLPALEQVEGMSAVWNWRAAHSYPLNALTMTLRNRALRIDSDATVAQRLKRSESIYRKLERQQNMQMSRMQDVGGCRAIVNDLGSLLRLFRLYKDTPLRHELTNFKDYVTEPKSDGYRSIHLMYRFTGRGSSLPWNKLRIEMQMRTRVQHAWATAVETVDAFTGQGLKFGSGSDDWERFFSLMASVHAFHEGTAAVPGTPSTLDELKSEVSELDRNLRIVNSLKSFARITGAITGGNFGAKHWHVLEMDPDRQRTMIKSFSQTDLKRAKDAYSAAEQRLEGQKSQVVLVSAESLIELRRAFPNYFADCVFHVHIIGLSKQRPSED